MSRDRFIAAVTTYSTARHVARVERENTLRRSVVVMVIAGVCRSALRSTGGGAVGAVSSGRSSCAVGRREQPGMCHVEASHEAQTASTNLVRRSAGLTHWPAKETHARCNGAIFLPSSSVRKVKITTGSGKLRRRDFSISGLQWSKYFDHRCGHARPTSTRLI